MTEVTYIQGNSFSLSVPLLKREVAKENDTTTITTEPFIPASGDVVTVKLIGERRQYTYTPTMSDNVAVVELSGNELCGRYAIEVTIITENGERMRYAQPMALALVPYTGTVDSIVVGSATLDASIFFAMCGAKGDKGDDGNGIVGITKTSTSGLVDTYTITYTDNTTSTFSVTNGKDGENGRDGTNGQDGTDGVGIVSITKTSTSGLVDTYTITMTNGTTTTFTVTNGSDATQVQSDWSQSDSTAVDFIKNKPTIPTIPATATQSEINAGSSTSQRTFTPKLVHDNAYIVDVPYTSSITELKANKMYDFGTVSSALTIPTLDATNDLVSNALNFYALRFVAGADDLNITFPTGVIVDDEPTINTGDYVEIMINLYVVNGVNNFYASIKVWQAQQ